MTQEKPFWETVKLEDMSQAQWESLCDGCGKCCLNKLINDDDEIFFTDAACWLLDLKTCRCCDYANRKTKVADCVVLDVGNISSLRWMPSSCAYRLLSEGKKLPDWHPLISGDPETVHSAGISIRGRAVSEKDVLDLDERIVDWID
jgi:hypothetical protein